VESKKEQIDEYAKITGQVVAKAWADDAFKARLLADPATVLREEGVPVPTYAELRAVENTDKVFYLVLPQAPSEDLSDEQLNQVSGGSTASTAGTMGTVSTLPCSTFGTAGSIACVGSV
jgi:hypothetical protein